MFAANAIAAPGGRVRIGEVFAAMLYTGTAGALTLTDNIDRTRGAVDIFKSRSDATNWAWYDTERGVQMDLASNVAASQTTQAQGVTAVSSTGVTIGTLAKINTSGSTYVKTTFRKASKFYKQGIISHTGGASTNVDLSELAAVGMVVVVRYAAASNWLTWHRSLSAGKTLKLNLTDAEAAGLISVSGTTLTLDSTLTTASYLYYAWAHDTASDGLIQCASFTTDASGNGTINHGWTQGAQYLEIKRSIGGTGDWEIFDTIRTSGFSGNDARLRFNLANIEDSVARLSASGTSISLSGLSASSTYIYKIIAAPLP